MQYSEYIHMSVIVYIDYDFACLFVVMWGATGFQFWDQQFVCLLDFLPLGAPYYWLSDQRLRHTTLYFMLI